MAACQVEDGCVCVAAVPVANVGSVAAVIMWRAVIWCVDSIMC